MRTHSLELGDMVAAGASSTPLGIIIGMRDAHSHGGRIRGLSYEHLFETEVIIYRFATKEHERWWSIDLRKLA
jgi:hypothetical protein